MATLNDMRKAPGGRLDERGLEDVQDGRIGARVGAGLVCAAAVALLSGAPTSAQGKELSEKSVQLLMQYAWALTPPKFTSPDGKTIEVDKSKPKDVIVSR